MSTFNAPLKWKEPGHVFTCSWSDFFIEQADAWRDDAWNIIRKTPHLTYQILTKRPERILDCLPRDWGNGWPNVWIGVSVESQRYMNRIPALLRIPAVVHFLSAEPLLGELDIRQWLIPGGRVVERVTGYGGSATRPALKWVIVGGESGPSARPMHPDWVWKIRDDCLAAGIAFFFKQWGEYISKIEIADLVSILPDLPSVLGWKVRSDWLAKISGREWGCFNEHGDYFKLTTTWNGQEDSDDGREVTVYRVGKKAAGRLLDGREWNEYPNTEVVV